MDHVFTVRQVCGILWVHGSSVYCEAGVWEIEGAWIMCLL